ncbi:MAG: cobalamin biosynthesis protein CbiD [Eubacterium sp.]|nr:cobalamin biosynthesis protein CbiD [Eubacterium sp.]
MAFEHYVRSGTKMLRCGYTTGTCAALASSGATRYALTGKVPDTVSVMTGKGILVETGIDESGCEADKYWCAVKKDAGDDIDATNGILIFSTVTLSDEQGVRIDGGEGVGRVTKPGLDQPVGNAAINSVPRRMIEDAVQLVLDEEKYEGGADVVISIPKGPEIAEKTFNPVLGVVGGISVLGTNGIVEPMSEQALIDTIEVEMRQKSEYTKELIITPGNYGETYLKGSDLNGIDIPVVKFSNFLGDTLDMAANMGFTKLLLVAHIGKMVKVAGAVMNTHSRWADGRAEIFTAHAAICGADRETCRRIMNAATTDASIEILDEIGLREQVIASILGKVQEKLEHRAGGAFEIGAVTFSNVYGYLGETDKAREIIKSWH